MDLQIKSSYESALKEFSRIGDQLDYHFPMYEYILDKIKEMGVKLLFLHHTQLIVVKEGVAVIKFKNPKMKKIILQENKINILAKAFQSFYCGEEISLVFVCSEDIIKPISCKQSSPDGKLSIFDLLEE